MIANDIAATTHNQTATRKVRAKPSCAPMMSAAICVASRAPLASPETLSPLGSKQAKKLPPRAQPLIMPDAKDPEATTLELAELWSFVLKKARKRWIWIALCRKTRQVVAYFIGDRSQFSCQQLWARIPEAYRQAYCYSDCWEAYSLVIPSAQHVAAGKEIGLTAHGAGWNNTLRQRLGRFVRASLSFSKSEKLHKICLRLFLHRYNLALASPA